VENLQKQIQKIHAKLHQPALVEEYIDGREINVALWGNGSNLTCLPISEIVFNYETSFPRIIDYNCKWVEDSYTYTHAKGVCPANLSEELKKRIHTIAKKVYQLTECRDYARVDFRLKNDKLYVLEINPNPCISRDSGFFRGASALGLSYDEMIIKMFNLAQERY
jgi:D-alanine-D-alanine ligase